MSRWAVERVRDGAEFDSDGDGVNWGLRKTLSFIRKRSNFDPENTRKKKFCQKIDSEKGKSNHRGKIWSGHIIPRTLIERKVTQRNPNATIYTIQRPKKNPKSARKKETFDKNDWLSKHYLGKEIKFSSRFTWQTPDLAIYTMQTTTKKKKEKQYRKKREKSDLEQEKQINQIK